MAVLKYNGVRKKQEFFTIQCMAINFARPEKVAVITSEHITKVAVRKGSTVLS